jgi:ribonuclease BN (tRNA processing enzyme)
MMNSGGIEFHVHGARGGRPAIGRAFEGFGGNTTCFSIETDQGLIIVDAGTGITKLNKLCAGWKSPKPIAILFSHYHLDHTATLAALEPLFTPGHEITMYGSDPTPGYAWRGVLKSIIGEPYWPVSFSRMPADIHFRNLDLGRREMELFGLQVAWCPVKHTQTCLAFRFELPGGKIAVATDHEPQLSDIAPFVSFCRGVDVLIHDGQYTPQEYATRRGWGHGTYIDAAEIAAAADVKRLVLTHHDPEHSDQEVELLIEATRKHFPNARGATEDMVFAFESPDSPPETGIRNAADSPYGG